MTGITRAFAHDHVENLFAVDYVRLITFSGRFAVGHVRECPSSVYSYQSKLINVP